MIFGAIFALLFTIAFHSGFFVQIAQAADAVYTGETADLSFIDSGGPQSIEDLLFRIMRFLNITIASLAVLAIMIGGVMLITSSGGENQMNTGKDIIKYSLIGLAIGIFGYLIVTLLQTVLYQIPS